jgi:hypothetical protein
MRVMWYGLVTYGSLAVTASDTESIKDLYWLCGKDSILNIVETLQI